MTEIDNKKKHTPYPNIFKVENVWGGQAAIEETRIAVWHIVEYYYKTGMSVEEVVAGWDYLTPAQIFSALAYYHNNKEEIDRVRQGCCKVPGSARFQRAGLALLLIFSKNSVSPLHAGRMLKKEIFMRSQASHFVNLTLQQPCRVRHHNSYELWLEHHAEFIA